MGLPPPFCGDSPSCRQAALGIDIMWCPENGAGGDGSGGYTAPS